MFSYFKFDTNNFHLRDWLESSAREMRAFSEDEKIFDISEIDAQGIYHHTQCPRINFGNSIHVPEAIAETAENLKISAPYYSEHRLLDCPDGSFVNSKTIILCHNLVSKDPRGIATLPLFKPLLTKPGLATIENVAEELAALSTRLKGSTTNKETAAYAAEIYETAANNAPCVHLGTRQGYFAA